MSIMGEVEKRFGQVNSLAFRQVNRVTDWWHLPTPVALLNLRGLRDDLRESNLHDTNAPPNGKPDLELDDMPKYRTYDGSAAGPDRPRDGQGRDALRPQHAERHRARDASRADGAEPARGLRAAAQARRVQAGRNAQRPRRLLDPVREPRLVRPRREHARQVHRRAPAGWRRLARRQPDEGEGDEPRPDAQEQERVAADLRQHRHALVGRLADLRLRRGAQPQAAQRDRRQAEDGQERGDAPQRVRQRSSTAST